MGGDQHKTTGAGDEAERWKAGEERSKKEECNPKNQGGQEDRDDCIPEASGFAAADKSSDERTEERHPKQ